MAFIAALGLKAPDILGSSLGSLISQTIAVNYGSNVTHVVLCDTALMGAGLNTISDPVSASNVFVAAQGVMQTVPSRTFPYYLPAGLEGLCRTLNLTSYMPYDVATAAQNTQQSTVGYDISGAGGNEASLESQG